MSTLKINGGASVLKGSLSLPGDKSISHRALILLSLGGGGAYIDNILYSQDVKRTRDILKQLGVDIELRGRRVYVEGVGLRGLLGGDEDLYCGNSGTSMRLLTGLLAGQDFDSRLSGDNSLSLRPMKRVIDPLELMGARIEAEKFLPPLELKKAGRLKGINYRMDVASAQVKSAILLAGLYCEGDLNIIESNISRNHTENMLEYLGVDISVIGGKISMGKRRIIQSKDIFVPGDISSAAYFMVGASILKGSDLILRDVGINETRDGVLEVINKMGGRLEVLNIHYRNNEKVGDIRVRSSRLRGISIGEDMIARLIDEIPIIAVAAAFAEGITEIESVGELRVKETDRLAAIIDELRKAGVRIWSEEDNLYIEGGSSYSSSLFESYGDHRMAMALSIFALACEGRSEIKNSNCIDISYPEFYRDLKVLLN